jgi:hypothetical protein
MPDCHEITRAQLRCCGAAVMRLEVKVEVKVKGRLLLDAPF